MAGTVTRLAGPARRGDVRRRCGLSRFRRLTRMPVTAAQCRTAE
jgi:hypothetical protein